MLRSEKPGSREKKFAEKALKRRNCNSQSAKSMNMGKEIILMNIVSAKTDLEKRKTRQEFTRTNCQFEINRGMFYRNLEGDTFGNIQCDKDKTGLFWENLWKKKETNFDFEKILDYKIDMKIENEIVDIVITEIIKKLSNWKAAGPDRLYNFWIKRLNVLWVYIAEYTKQCIYNPENMHSDLFKGLTYLIPKCKNPGPKDFRPITCMSNIYKIVTKTVTHYFIYVRVTELLSNNQLGTTRDTLGAKEQAMTNKALNNLMHNKLKTTWIDIKKAYGSIDHELLITNLRHQGIPVWITHFIEQTTKQWKGNSQQQKHQKH